jgi:hypothetical protein
MKRFVAALSSSFLLASLAPAAFADEPPPAPVPETAPETTPDDGPCKKVVEACKAAGFKKGDHKSGKGLHKDCVQKLLAGQTVDGVTVDSADVESCKAAPKPTKPPIPAKPIRKLLKKGGG